MEEKIASSAGAVETQKMNAATRLYGVIFSPQATFENISQYPTWLLPLILVIIAGVLSGYFLQDLVWQKAMEQIQNNPKLSPDQIQSALQSAEKITRISAWAAPLISTPIIYLLISGIFMFTGNILLGGETRFKNIFSVICWSSIITILSAIVNVPVMLNRGEMASATNLTFLAPSAEQKSVTYFLLSQIDLFNLWWIVIMGLGLAAIYKFTQKKGITIVVGWWVLFLLVASVIKLAF